MTTRTARRLALLEAALRPLPADQAALARLEDELNRQVPKALTFHEITVGQRALESFSGDVLAAVEGDDPTILALIAAARARRQGVKIAPLFGESD